MSSNTHPTDAELERDWKPNGRRPQSTIARSFSQELMDIFRIENSVADLDEKIDKRKQNVTNGQTELEALEARIKEMEARLKTQPGGSGPSSGGSPRAQRSALGNDTFGGQPAQQQQQRPLQASRPGTAKQAQHAPLHGGAMPPTPTASEGESDLVINTSTSSSSPSIHSGADSRSFTDYVIVSKDGDRDI